MVDKPRSIQDRWGDDESPDFPVSICPQCKYYNRDGTCKAFPGGVPSGFLNGSLQHREKIGDEQFTFTPITS